MDQILKVIHDALGINETHLLTNKLRMHLQPPLEKLQVVDVDCGGRPFILIHSAAKAWLEMKNAAALEGIELLPFSGFRSYVYQKNLIEQRLKEGRELENILTHVAIPGFSEHHSGRAIDIHEPGKPSLEEAFELSESFKWLQKNASRFNFRMSYPKDNPHGIIYEPWHWFYTGS
ncbi:D-alanyl-D-alanine carboxypeptidase family protein [Bdellovibrio sp. KM01]|uniref:M15 family metallopeptidase n=1 Tax=Bdellovibrio sp. KM01 TaxID=2748865 RepID=UPI0015EAFE0C|nr:M15 family metallopeptidase [Bdellovibrio sp. KM01]QLY26081.1 D-alanyl-D-alanine carboxypeptidase family protein [Bdellovibrio sp. KM01]